MSEHFLEKYKKERSESESSSGDEVISTLSKKPFSSGVEASKPPANKFESVSYGLGHSSMSRKSPDVHMRTDYGLRRGSQGKPVDNFTYPLKPVSKPPELPNPERNPISVLRSLSKQNLSNYAKTGENSVDDNEVTFQWNEQTGSLTLVENKAAPPRKSPKEYSRRCDDGQIELEELSKHLMSRSRHLESFLKELASDNHDMILFKPRLMREIGNVQSDLKEAHDNILLLMKERGTLKEQLAMCKSNVKKLAGACKLAQEEIKAYNLL